MRFHPSPESSLTGSVLKDLLMFHWRLTEMHCVADVFVRGGELNTVASNGAENWLLVLQQVKKRSWNITYPSGLFPLGHLSPLQCNESYEPMAISVSWPLRSLFSNRVAKYKYKTFWIVNSSTDDMLPSDKESCMKHCYVCFPSNEIHCSGMQ